MCDAYGSSIICIFRLHHSTVYVDRCGVLLPTEYHRPTAVRHTSEPCKNGCTDRDAISVEDLGGPREHVLDGAPDPLLGRGNFEGGRSVPL